MWRAFVAALTLSLVLPAAPAAQQDPAPQARFTVSPFVGARVPFTSTRTYRLSEGNDHVALTFEEEHGGGPAAGAELEVRVRGTLSVVGALAYSRAGEVIVTDRTNGGTDRYIDMNSPSVWFGRAGVAVRLPEPQIDNRRFRSVAIVWAGPAVVRERRPGHEEVPAELSRAINHFALNIGAKASAPLGGSSLAFQLGLEDYITFWNTAEWERRTDRVFEPVRSDYRYPVSNILMLRTGISLQL